MPTYDYKCRQCNNVQEETHNITELPKISCSICGSECEKQFSLNKNFILKGGDWPSQGFRIKKQMTEKNSRMKSKMIERERSGEGVRKLSDLK
jgi:putative FmdB family regulatory protein